MKRDFCPPWVRVAIVSMLACSGCTRFQKDAPSVTGFGLLHRNVESTKLPTVGQVNHEQVVTESVSEEKRDESSGQFLERQINWLRGRGENEQAAVRLLAEAEQIYNRATNARATGNGVNATEEIEELYLKAAEIYDLAALRWPDSALEEDAMFMAAESYFFGKLYPEADERYERVVTNFPKSRYLDRVQRRRFSIAHYWLQVDEQNRQMFYEFNLTDETLPWRDRFNYAVRILDQIRLDDPTGDIADDATVMAADACLAIGRYQQAENLYSDLIKTFPSSEHQFHAHWLAIQTKLRLYRGPEYGGTALLEAEKLLTQLRRQFPQQIRDRHEDVVRLRAEIHYKKAERQWSVAEFFHKRASYGAARIYYRTLVDDYSDTPFAANARQRLVSTEGRPSKPNQRLQWLANMFDDKEDIGKLLKDVPASNE